MAKVWIQIVDYVLLKLAAGLMAQQPLIKSSS